MRVWRKVKFFLGSLLLMGSAASAQDAHFSQQYATKLRLNPAFVGLTGETNITAAYRSQWSTLPGAFISNHVSGEMRFGESKSSGGIYSCTTKPAAPLLPPSNSAAFMVTIPGSTKTLR
jgi:hypothetical protein